MKFQVTFKDPDVVDDACDDAGKESAATVASLSESERADLAESRADEFKALTRRWCRYGEYVTIEFDTEAETASVVRCK